MTSARVAKAAIVAALAGLTVPAVAGQQVPTFRTGVDVVQVDVSVLDKNRKPARGLTTADFTVLEDGKPRPIVAFTPVELPSRDTRSGDGAAAWTREVAPDVATNTLTTEGRLVVIVFDWSIRFQDQASARKVATAAVEGLGPNDLGAVVFTSAFANAGAPQNFTADRARLQEAINRPFAAAPMNPCTGPSRDPRNFNCAMIDDPEGYESGDCKCRVCVMDAVTRVADAVRSVEGRRKVVLFISSYFYAIDFTAPIRRGATQLGIGGASLEASRVAPPSRYLGTCSSYITDSREHLTRAATLANLTVHVIDPVGLETAESNPMGGYWNDGTNTGSGIQRRQQMLPLLADITGGRAVMNTNAPETAVPAILDETQAFYLLGFESTDYARNGREHRIEVKVARPGVIIQSRAAYTAGETPAAQRAAAKKLPLVRAVDDPLPRSDVPLSLSAAAFATAGKNAAVTLVLQAQQDALSASEGGTPGAPPAHQVRIVAAAVDPRAHIVASRESTAAVRRGSSAGPYEILTRLDLAPGRYEIRLAADLASGQRGSVYTYVDVPDFAKLPLSVSGLVVQATPAVIAAPLDMFEDVLPFVPTAKRDLTQDDRVTAMLRLYEGRETSRPAEVWARIIDTADRVVLEERRAFAADAFAHARAADYQLELPLARLTAGDYVVALVVTSGQLQARRNLRFHVQ